MCPSQINQIKFRFKPEKNVFSFTNNKASGQKNKSKFSLQLTRLTQSNPKNENRIHILQFAGRISTLVDFGALSMN